MNTNYHPDAALLQDYGRGTGGEARLLLVASHVALCPDCRKEAAIYEAVGGSLLLAEPDGTMNAEAALARILPGLETPPAPPTVPARSDVPRPLRPYIGRELGQVPWRAVTHGLSYRMLIKDGPVKAYVTKSAPGAGIGVHSHRGNELTLVLQGGFSDEAGHYERGDLIAATPAIRHAPVADADGDCITLAMTDAPLTFPNWAVGLIARIFGF